MLYDFLIAVEIDQQNKSFSNFTADYESDFM